GLKAAGKAVWQTAWSMDWITPADAAQVAHLAVLEDRAATLCDYLARDGTTLTKPLVSPRGEVVGDERYEHPALRALRGLDKPLHDLPKSPGFAPKSGPRLCLQVEEEPTEVDELKAQREARLKVQRDGTLKPSGQKAMGWQLLASDLHRRPP